MPALNAALENRIPLNNIQGRFNQMQGAINSLQLQFAAVRHNSRSRLRNSTMRGDFSQLTTIRCEEVGPMLNQELPQIYPVDTIAAYNDQFE